MPPSRKPLLRERLPRAVWRATAWRGLQVIADVPYAPDPGCRLDVLIPPERPPRAPVVLHIHGGAFRVFSKETHGYPAGRYARAGFITLNVNYRLAPENPFPAAVVDAHRAYAWAVREVHRFGGDPSRILVSGESAGGNLALGLCISTVTERPEPWAQALAPLPPPAAAHIAYGFLQVQRHRRSNHTVERLIGLRLGVIEEDYLRGADPTVPVDYANPLDLVEEAATRGHTPFPPVLALCGTWDVIAGDTRRLERTLARVGASVQGAWIPQAVHGFHTVPGYRSELAWRALLAHARSVVE